MDVTVTRSRWFSERSNRAQLSSLLRAVSGVALVLLAGISGWLFLRRITGALSEPLSPFLLLATGAAVVAFAALLRGVWFSAALARRSDRRAPSIGLVLPTVAIVLLAATLSLPGTSPWAVVGFWAIVVGVELGIWFIALRRAGPRNGFRRATNSLRRTWLTRLSHARRGRPPIVLTPGLGRDEPNEEESRDEEPLAPDMLHKLSRRLTTSGSELIAGLWRVPFAPGERTTNVHIAFCPPLVSLPKVSVIQRAGPPAAVKVGQVQSFGLRLDVRLSETAALATNVVLHVEAVTTVASAAPAH